MNGTYLKLLLTEIQDSIVNHVINRVSCKERLVQIELDTNSLFISLFPQALCVYISNRAPDFRKLEHFDDHLSGCHINAASQPDLMPMLILSADKTVYGQRRESRIVISLYREAPNLTVRAADLKKSLYARTIEKKSRKTLLELTDNDLVDKDELVKHFEGIDKNLARELNHENLAKLKKIIAGEAARPRLVSVTPLRISYFAQTYITEYPSLNDLLQDALQRFIEQNKITRLESAKKMRIKKIERQMDRLKKNLLDNLAIEDYRTRGELILAGMVKIKKGMKSIMLTNPYTQAEVEIGLDPTKSPQDNAQQYFKKYKKLKRGTPRIAQKIALLKKEIENIESQLISDGDQDEGAGPKAARPEKPLPFRTFALSSGSTVHVGKSSKSNDLLTFRFARPDDYFFHARGIEGAHVILKPRISRSQNPRKEDIEAAASIAAFFSKAKKQKKVPVSYTQRKYLKKNKKGKPGSVILMREEVVFVDPVDPTLVSTTAPKEGTHG